MTETKQGRGIEKEIEIVAPVDEMWKALTEPKELVKWFPLDARVRPGVGGKIFWMHDPEGNTVGPWKMKK